MLGADPLRRSLLAGVSLACFLLACAGLTGCGGASSSSTGKAPMPTITSFAADPTGISLGASATLSWSTTGATSIAITPGAFTSTSATGSTSVSPTATTTYTLTAAEGAGSTTATATATVGTSNKPVINTFTASPTSIASGSATTLSWATTGATSIAITPGTFTSASSAGSTSVSPTATTTYTLSANNSAGSTTATAQVTVPASGGTLTIETTSCPGGSKARHIRAARSSRVAALLRTHIPSTPVPVFLRCRRECLWMQALG
jgi:hypothetical protein